ncbi:MAG: segregation/condensation protein A [Planctomycetales bacterium]|nr:segregation/condensation protein A [Planctomycetales bacterium]
MNKGPSRTILPPPPTRARMREAIGQWHHETPIPPAWQALLDDDSADDQTPMFCVDLDIFRGPLDLLLYLVRKHELSITEIPIAPITVQFLDYLSVLEQLDVNAVGDFLEMASTLIEIKSKLLLPQTDEEAESEEPWEDPRQQLVQQLLEYKQYRDAASVLEERSRNWSQCYPRLSNDLPPREVNPAAQPIQEVELWDLVSAMGRIIRTSEVAQPTSIVYDETPIQVYMQRIHELLRTDGQVAFTDMFEPSMHKSAMIGVFLAVLELVRHHCVIAEQEQAHGEIYLRPGVHFANDLELHDVDEYQGANKPR